MSSIDRAIYLAVLKVFRDFRVNRVGGSLELADLQTAWSASGLRALDLSAGLASLECDGVLRLDTSPAFAAARVTLLAVGESRLRGVRGAIWSGLEALGGASALRMYVRRRGSSALFRGIRRTDAPLPTLSGPVASDPDRVGVTFDPVRG